MKLVCTTMYNIVVYLMIFCAYKNDYDYLTMTCI